MQGKRQTVDDLRKKIGDMAALCEELRDCVDMLDFSGARKRMTWLSLRLKEFDAVAIFVERDLRNGAFNAIKRISTEQDLMGKMDVLQEFIRTKTAI